MIARPQPMPRRLIVNADDFGLSPGINAAVVRTHREGILTSASLMVNEVSSADAVALAKENPNLGVGLHLTLLCGHSTLPREKIPGLVNDRPEFSHRPINCGLRYFFSRRLRPQLKDEIEAQFEKFHATGLGLDHVNGHLHIHLHPVVFDILMENAGAWGIRRLRLTRDSFWLNVRLAHGRWLARAANSAVFHLLAARARRTLARQQIRHTDAVFGLLQDGRVNEDYIAALLQALPPGDSELYSHPSLDKFTDEFAALVSPRVRRLVEEQGIRLVRYQDL